ncbi:hypothetical protein BP6252_11256 [Coleophoma cylindrospora]|uniref:Uncharacterized protein n=1 Tax=Coleophoma cylindrospora TaxID=1849047 RepID=A0A3D8QPR2_9HELO|nr:hypothetical protein BP6252_11256 [Coleophoma cylindrospora]
MKPKVSRFQPMQIDEEAANPQGENASLLQQPPEWQALRVEIFQINPDSKYRQGVIQRDGTWFCGILTILIQLGIAGFAWWFSKNWAILMVTGAGTLLSLAQGALPQWRTEKWVFPKPKHLTTKLKAPGTVSITRGNGSRHVMVILGSDHSGTTSAKPLDLELMACSDDRRHCADRLTIYATFVFTILWTALLITVAGPAVKNTWYLIIIGVIGMLQNLYVAGATREMGSLGIHLNLTRPAFHDTTIPRVLRRVEESYEGVGVSLIPIFFPGGMRADEEDCKFWATKAQSQNETARAKKGFLVGERKVEEIEINQHNHTDEGIVVA